MGRHHPPATVEPAERVQHHRGHRHRRSLGRRLRTPPTMRPSVASRPRWLRGRGRNVKAARADARNHLSSHSR